MAEENGLKYTDGDIGLLRTLVEMKRLFEETTDTAEKEQIKTHLDYLEKLRSTSSDLRQRALLSSKAANEYVSVMLEKGTTFSAAVKGDETGKEVEVNLPVGLTASPIKLISDAMDKITGHFDELGLPGDLDDFVGAALAPVFHRLLLADSALLDLRDFNLIDVQNLPQRSAAIVGEIVAKAEVITGGTHQTPLAMMNGYIGEQWNYGTVPLNSDPDDVSCRKLFVVAAGYEHPVVVFSHIKIDQVPGENGQIMTAAGVDPFLLTIINPQLQLIPSFSIGAWREPTEEELNSGVFDKASEVHHNHSSYYKMVIAQLEAQEKAGNDPKIDLITDPDVDKSTGLILPDNMK